MSKTRWLLFILLIALIGGLGWHFSRPKKNDTAAAEAPKKGVPVSVATVVAADIPVWLSGIGTAEASSVVTVRPRVSGTLDSVNFIEGQTVAAGAILAQIDPRPYRATLEQAKAKKAQDAALLENAKRELARIRELVESDAESRRILDQQEATVAQLTAALQADDAALDAAQLDFDFTTVRAPIAGRTGIRKVDAGNIVIANQETGIVVVTQIQPINVIFTLPQHNLAALRPHMKNDTAPLKVQALDATTGAILSEGKLSLVDNLIDQNSGTLRLKAVFENNDTALWPGEYVTARILVQTLEKVPVVPSDAIQAGLNGPFVYLTTENDTVAVQPIRAGARSGGVTVIEDGLKPGDKVVREGHSKLKPGAKISVVSDEEKK